MKPTEDRFNRFTDRELERIWEALSSFDAGGREQVEAENDALFREAAEARRWRRSKPEQSHQGPEQANPGDD